MAELIRIEPEPKQPCCSKDARASCCDEGEKRSCCGDSNHETCGCQTEVAQA